MNEQIGIANDPIFGEQLGVVLRPRWATVTVEISANIKYTVQLAEADGDTVDAWSLNGMAYGVGQVVALLFLGSSVESAVILGAKSGFSTTAGKLGKLTLTSLPTSAAGLNAGDLWNDSGTVKVA